MLEIIYFFTKNNYILTCRKKIAADYGSNVNLFDILSIHKKEWALVQKVERVIIFETKND